MTYVWLATLVAALGGLLFGYDTAVISGAIGLMERHFHLDPAMMGWAASCALIGCMIGASTAGWLSDRFGRKKVLVLAAVIFLVSAVGSALPRELSTFILFRTLCGVGVGIASITSPLYIAELSPAPVRGRMVSVNQFGIISGMLIVYFVNFAILREGDPAWNEATAWRWMFASGAVPSVVLLLLALVIPESPRWLMKAGRTEAALGVLTRVGGPAHARAEAEAIRAALSEEEGTLGELFRPGLRKVLVIGILLAVFQQVTGINAILYYAPEIFKNMGMADKAALWQTVLVGAVNMAFTLVAIRMVDQWGRRPLMLAGFAGMFVGMMALGTAAYLQKVSASLLPFILGYIAAFAISVGPVTWVILSEIFPTKIRGRAMAIATLVLWASCFLVSQTFPMLDQHPALVAKFHHGFTFWLFGALCLLAFLFVWRVIPETKGRSLEDIERMWHRRPPPGG